MEKMEYEGERGQRGGQLFMRLDLQRLQNKPNSSSFVSSHLLTSFLHFSTWYLTLQAVTLPDTTLAHFNLYLNKLTFKYI